MFNVHIAPLVLAFINPLVKLDLSFVVFMTTWSFWLLTWLFAFDTRLEQVKLSYWLSRLSQIQILQILKWLSPYKIESFHQKLHFQVESFGSMIQVIQFSMKTIVAKASSSSSCSRRILQQIVQIWRHEVRKLATLSLYQILPLWRENRDLQAYARSWDDL